MSNQLESGAGSKPGNFLKLLVLTVAILLALTAVQIFRSASKRPDPHFVAAQKMVNDYELGREQASRNYRHPVYRKALSRLKRVNLRSISAEPAAELRARIERDSSRFEQRGKSVRKNRAVATHDRRVRAEALAASGIATEMVLPRTYPECEHGESADHPDD